MFVSYTNIAIKIYTQTLGSERKNNSFCNINNRHIYFHHRRAVYSARGSYAFGAGEKQTP